MTIDDPAQLPIAIDTPDGRALPDGLLEIDSWNAVVKAQRTGADQVRAAVRYEDLVAETHHRSFGRPWIMGRFYVDHLISRGVRPEHRVLDVGCGSGRVGVHLIKYLSPERYFGFDAHLGSLVAFSAYEAPLHDLVSRRPRLMWTHDFAAEAFATTFDVILDFYVTRHLGPESASAAYARLRRSSEPGTRLIFCHAPILAAETMEELGWRETWREEVAYPVPVADAGFQTRDLWTELTAVEA